MQSRQCTGWRVASGGVGEGELESGGGGPPRAGFEPPNKVPGSRDAQKGGMCVWGGVLGAPNEGSGESPASVICQSAVNLSAVCASVCHSVRPPVRPSAVGDHQDGGEEEKA